MRRVLQKQDAGHAGLADGRQHRCEVRSNQPLPVDKREQPRPRVEDLHGVRARTGLGDEILRHRGREFPQKVVQGFGLARREGPQRREVLDAAAFHQIRGQRPRGAAKAKHGDVGGGFGADGADRLQHFRGVLGAVGPRERRHVVLGPNRFGDHGPRREVEVDAEGRQRTHDVGEDDCRIQPKALERQQGHLRGQVGRLRQFLEGAALAQRLVLGEVAPRLAHDPHRPSGHRLEAHRLQQQRFGHRSTPPVNR